MLDEQRMMAVPREQDDRAAAMRCHLHHQRIVGLEDGMAVRGDDLDDGALDARELFDRFDVGDAQMIALGDVGDDGDIAAIEAQPGAEDAAACRFQHGRLDARIGQDGAGADRPAAIAGLRPLAVNVDALGAGHADAALRARQNVGDQPRRRRLAVDAGDGRDGNAARLSIGEELIQKGVSREVARSMASRESRCWYLP